MLAVKENTSVITARDVTTLLQKNGISCDLCGDKATMLSQPVALDLFEGDGITFYTGDNPDRISAFRDSSRGLILCNHCLKDELGAGPFLFVDDVRLAFILVARLFMSPPENSGIHSTAVIHPEAQIGRGVTIGPNSVIGAARIGNDVNIGSLVTITDHVVIGNSVIIMNGVHLGDPGLGNAVDKSGRQILFPHFERVVIEDNVVIGTATVIQRGVLKPTMIGEGSIMSAKCLVGHNCRMGCHVFVSAGANIGGSAHIGDRSFLGLGCCIRDNIDIAPETTVGMNATVTKSCPEPGLTIIGNPARPVGKLFGAARR